MGHYILFTMPLWVCAVTKKDYEGKNEEDEGKGASTPRENNNSSLGTNPMC